MEHLGAARNFLTQFDNCSCRDLQISSSSLKVIFLLLYFYAWSSEGKRLHTTLSGPQHPGATSFCSAHNLLHRSDNLSCRAFSFSVSRTEGDVPFYWTLCRGPCFAEQGPSLLYEILMYTQLLMHRCIQWERFVRSPHIQQRKIAALLLFCRFTGACTQEWEW